MDITAVPQLDKRKEADLIVVPCWQEEKGAIPALVCKSLEHVFKFPIASGDFLGKEGESLFLYTDGIEKRVVLLGLGKKKGFSEDVLRRSYAALVKPMRSKKMESLNLLVPEIHKCQEERAIQLICEGVLLANYSFNQLRGESLKEASPLLKKMTFVGVPASVLTLAKQSSAVISSVHWARDLVNQNADNKSPDVLAAVAKQISKEYPAVKTQVLGKKELEKEKMGLLLAVNRGSIQDPALIIVAYQGNPSSKEKTALIGKGVVFDTGGLNLKPTGSMETMKCDMSGAAAALGTVRAAAALGLKCNLVAVVPATENAMGPNSYKPGDVYTSHCGKTVEISNTDAEGRLILADAISYTQEHLKPTRIIDLATLTGAIVVAIGEEMSGLFCNDEALAVALIEAGERSSELLWRMPLFQGYKEMLKSPIADMKNSAGRKGGSIIAALFLEAFVKEGTPWAHLDIAGAAFLEHPKGYNPTQATGVGIRLLIELLSDEKK